MLFSFVLTTFPNFYGNRHIDHAINGSYIVQRYVDLKTQPSPPQMLGFFFIIKEIRACFAAPQQLNGGQLLSAR
jgi:hypothetical protein